MEKHWQKSEIAHLKRHTDDQTLEELAQRFHTDPATVERKLEELGLKPGSSSSANDEKALELYGEGLEAVHAGKWKQASKLLEKTIAATDRHHLRDRAGQFLDVCRVRLAEDSPVEDPYTEAVYEKNRGEIDKALELCGKPAEKDDDGSYTYLLASLQALGGSEDEALETLTKAIEIDPRNRVHAYHDPDFEALRGREEFDQLLAVA